MFFTTRVLVLLGTLSFGLLLNMGSEVSEFDLNVDSRLTKSLYQSFLRLMSSLLRMDSVIPRTNDSGLHIPISYFIKSNHRFVVTSLSFYQYLIWQRLT